MANLAFRSEYERNFSYSDYKYIDVRYRNLIYFQTLDSSEDLVSGILKTDWHVYNVSDLKNAYELQKKFNFSVGIINVSEACLDNEFFQQWKIFCSKNPDIQWIALVSPESIKNQNLSDLVKTNFFDYHTLPIDKSRLSYALGHAQGMAKLKSAYSDYSSQDNNTFGIVGRSAVIRKLRSDIEKVSRVDAPTLIYGESGTGKELAAYAIHAKSKRCKAPFVTVNCASIPTNLIQSELFGYEKGSFTGAEKRKIGRIESAAGGTLFLDEIGDLPLELQGNLLRFLQEKTIERVGGIQSIPVDVRIIAATHVNIERAAAEGCFRQDLYYRLNVLNLEIPPLRKRENDIELLAKFFFEKFLHEKNSIVKGFSQQSLDVMQKYSWPGNVREMINRIRHAMIMSENRLISPADLRLARHQSESVVMPLSEARSEAERKTIASALQCTRNNISQAAQILGISRMTLHRLMQKHGF
jgi:DNA-binding NtrC family response regulator